MYGREKHKTLFFDFLPLLLIIIIISSISLSSITLSSFYATANSRGYNMALAFEPAIQNNTTNETATTIPGLVADTDKAEYVVGEQINIDGKVEKVIEGKNVRVDLYAPDGKPITIVYSSATPDEEGFFSYSGPYGVSIPSDAKPGEYTLLVTYNKESVESKLMVK